MIYVNVNRIGKDITINMEGHAGYAPQGQDIVCSAVSILAYSFANMLITHSADRVRADLDGDKRCIQFREGNDKVIETILEQFMMGLCLIEAEFPDNLKIVNNS